MRWLRSLVDSVKHDAEVAELKEENQQLREVNHGLEEQVQDLTKELEAEQPPNQSLQPK